MPPVCYNGAEAKIVTQQDGSVALEVVTPSSAQSYAVSIPGVLGGGSAAPTYLKVCFQVPRGQVAVCLVDHLAKSMVDAPYLCAANDDVYEVYFDCSKAEPQSQLMFRSGVKNEVSQFRLLSCEPIYDNANAEINGQLKRSRARQFAHWYYDSDLGDGVVIPCYNENSMAGLRRACDIQLGLIQRYFGSIKNWTVLDAPCSAGYHSFRLVGDAGAGLVLGIDHDEAAIRQASFVRDCKGRFTPQQVQFRNIDLLGFNMPDNSFDLVYCSGVFYHLRDHVLVARKLYNVAKKGIMMQSSIINDPRDIFILGDPSYGFCADWEFAFVPSPSMMWKIMEYVGFKDLQMFDANEITFNEAGEMIWKQNPERDAMHLPPSSNGPIYILGRK
jgi:SAM-dependent methyltransferase